MAALRRQILYIGLSNRFLSTLATSHFTLEVLPEQLICCPQILRQTLQGFLLQLRRHPVKGFGNAAAVMQVLIAIQKNRTAI